MNILKLFSMVMLAGAAYALFDTLSLHPLQAPHNPTPIREVMTMPRTITAPMAPPTTFTTRTAAATDCRGHTRCSEMRSCAEARYWLSRCAEAEMDGDGDGIPCERQWCQTVVH